MDQSIQTVSLKPANETGSTGQNENASENGSGAETAAQGNNVAMDHDVVGEDAKRQKLETNSDQPNATVKPQFPSLLELIESEIWARAETQWRHPTTAGFAQEAVDMGLCENLKQAKKEIRKLFEESEFSVRRVVERYLNTLPVDEVTVHNIENLVERMMHEYGGAITNENAQGEIEKLLGINTEENDNSPIDSEDEAEPSSSEPPVEATAELDETTKLVVDRLTSIDLLRTAAKRAGLDLARMPTMKSLSFSSVLDLIEQLDNVESGRTSGKNRKELLSKLEKKMRPVVPLNYQASKYPAKAVADLLDLALVSSASHASIPSGVRCTQSSIDDVFLIEHQPSVKRSKPFQRLSVSRKFAWFSTSELGAAFVLQNGHPFPGLDREIVLHGRRRKRTLDSASKDASVWILFEVATDIKHCGIEHFDDADDDDEFNDDEEAYALIGGESQYLDRNERMHLYEVDAMVPVLLRLA